MTPEQYDSVRSYLWCTQILLFDVLKALNAYTSHHEELKVELESEVEAVAKEYGYKHAPQ